MNRTWKLLLPVLLVVLLVMLWRQSRPGHEAKQIAAPTADHAAGRPGTGDTTSSGGDHPSWSRPVFPPLPSSRGPAQVEGRVLDAASGESVPGVDVVFHSRAGDQTATSDGNGNYVTTLEPDTYRVRAIGSDVLGLPAPRLEVRGGEPSIRFDIRVQQLARVSGTVVDSTGRGVEGAEVEMAATSRLQRDQVKFGDLNATATSDATGRFAVQVISTDPTFLQATSGDSWGYARVEGVTPGGNVDGVVITLSGVTIAGVVVTPDGEPVADAAIHLMTRDGRFTRTRDATSDDQGRFEMNEVMPGVAFIEARKPGFAGSVPTKLELQPAERREVKLALQPPLVLAGMVVDPAGEPVAQARVRAGRAGSHMGPLETYTDDNGGFRFETTDSGPWWVGAYRPELAIGEAPSVRPPITDLVLRLLAFGGIQGHVQEIGGKPVTNFEVVLVEHTRVGQKKPRKLNERTQHSDADGNFRLYPLEPGTYKLQVRAGKKQAELAGVEVEGNQAATVTATLK